MCPSDSSAAASNRPICTICYEDLKTVAEDLQVIPNCGHVFHELCLQQWLEYCPAGKRPTCPFCKQPCTRTSPTRLYFQSTGDPTQIPSSPNRHSPGPGAVELAEEVRKLEAKLSSVTSNFENQQTHLKKLNDELSAWKDLAKSEEAKKAEMKRNKDLVEQLLQMKTEELSRKSSECLRLQQRSLGLAKELAALKLATNLNLGEEEIMKLASLGHGGNPENAVVMLRKSLALRNKNYKELMARCNILGREGNKTALKLDKAKEKIKKLLTRLQEVEKALEEKENDILRYLKASHQPKAKGAMQDLTFSGFKSHLMEDQTGLRDLKRTLEEKENGALRDFSASYQLKAEGMKFSCDTAKPVEAFTKSSQIEFSGNQTCYSNINENVTELQKDLTSSYAENNSVDLESDPHSYLDDDDFEVYPNSHRPPTAVSTWQDKYEFETHGHVNHTSGSWSSGNGVNNFKKVAPEEFVQRNETNGESETPVAEKLSIDSKQATSVTVRNKALVNDSATCAGQPYFPGSLLGIEGAGRSFGNWHKHSHTTSPFMKPTSSSDTLIAVGADGRGGTVKVLRGRDSFLDAKAQTLQPKRQKQVVKQSGQPQIEHFFGKKAS